MPAGVSTYTYLKFTTAALLSMLAGLYTVTDLDLICKLK